MRAQGLNELLRLPGKETVVGRLAHEHGAVDFAGQPTKGHRSSAVEELVWCARLECPTPMFDRPAQVRVSGHSQGNGAIEFVDLVIIQQALQLRQQSSRES